MKRYIEILDDSNEVKQYNSDSLPLEIKYLLIEKDIQLFISEIKEDGEVDNKIICAYISEDEGYIFFQPESENNKVNIFHNNELIEKSVWLKSGDELEISGRNIIYNISGDKVQIKVRAKTAYDAFSEETPKVKKQLIPPPPSSPIVNNNTSHTDNEKTTRPNSLRKIIISVTAILLFLIAAFVLVANTLEIKIEPIADNIIIDGFFPAIEIDNRYVLINGEYDLKAYKEGYQVLNKTLNVGSEKKIYSFNMIEKPGLIEFDIVPKENNKIYINNELLNNPSKINNEFKIDKGEYNLTVINPRYKKYDENIKVEGIGQYQKFKIKLVPNWGYVDVLSETEGTLININSGLNGNIPVYTSELKGKEKIELIAGDYTIKLSKDKYKEKIENISIISGKTISLNIDSLELKDGTINLTSEPTGSLIRIDGNYMGKTPLSIKLSPNVEYEVKLNLLGYKDISEKIQIGPAEIKDHNMIFNSIKGNVYITVIPQKAQLFINGVKQKKSSGKFLLNGMSQSLMVKANGYTTQTKEINMSNSYSQNINFVLKKENLIKKKNQNKVVSKSNKNIRKKQTNNTYTNSIHQKMILMKPTTFIMGAYRNDANKGSNEKEYKVKLDYSYFLSETEISNKQFKKFRPSHKSGITSGLTLNSSDQPVVNVSWNDAAEFCNWLSKKEGLKLYYKNVNGKMVPVSQISNINGYRLPYEVEWEVSAKNKMRNKYPWGESFPPKKLSGNFSDESAQSIVANFIEDYDDSNAVSAPVGSYTKNLDGFYDLGGNVSEWCQDYYSPNPVPSGSKLLINPKGPAKGKHRVVKDSSWRDSSIKELRFTYRSYLKENQKANDVGFRIARYLN